MENGNYLMQFFSYEHLPERLQKASKPFCKLAAVLMETLPDNQEKVDSLKSLLIAKDHAVRAILFDPAKT